MPPDDLKPAIRSDIEDALAYALRHNGRREFRHAGEHTAGITAAHLVNYLEQAGFVVMQKPKNDRNDTGWVGKGVNPYR